MILGDGVTRLREMRALGVPVALGRDGGCTNNRLSIFEEMRMAALLQKVTHLDGTAFSAEEAFRLGTAGGGEVLGLPVGEIAPIGWGTWSRSISGIRRFIRRTR
jgi:5-methylthioadenosine/S-adenosylhomocysteine deaminase